MAGGAQDVTHTVPVTNSSNQCIGFTSTISCFVNETLANPDQRHGREAIGEGRRGERRTAVGGMGTTMRGVYKQLNQPSTKYHRY